MKFNSLYQHKKEGTKGINSSVRMVNQICIRGYILIIVFSQGCWGFNGVCPSVCSNDINARSRVFSIESSNIRSTQSKSSFQAFYFNIDVPAIT